MMTFHIEHGVVTLSKTKKYWYIYFNEYLSDGVYWWKKYESKKFTSEGKALWFLDRHPSVGSTASGKDIRYE